MTHEDPSFGKAGNTTRFHIGFEGSFGANMVGPRELVASYICQLVCVEGIVTKCSLVRPKVVESVHYCKATNHMHTRVYRDVTSPPCSVSSITIVAARVETVIGHFR